MEALKFKYHPRNETVIEGVGVEMTCVLEEQVPDSSLSWIRNGQKITEGKIILKASGQLLHRDVRTAISMLSGEHTSYRLEIPDVMYSDSGKYVCAVYQNGIDVKSEVAHLKVNQLPDPMYPICDPTVNQIREGSRVKLKCTGDAIDPPTELRLLKYVTDIHTDTEVLLYRQTTPITYSFIANTDDNNAIFTCQLTTPADPSIARNCSFGPLNVWYKPSITIQHAGTTLSRREAIFICQTNANPPVTDFIWQFDPPLSIDRYEIDDIGQVMRILRVNIGDNGLIVKCTARNNVEDNVVGQPDVYFEPQDRLTLPLPNKRHSVLWRRSFGAQVPTDRDVDAMYLEIQSDHYIFTPDSRCNTLP
ncbi:kin of IRRE-like protein 1 [Anneissia japonica]|uniref:kin of IRRE-like protein 1 n=1 Tax=Anneissia japonica TaxID=1529436 RepID=UPI001425878E|nr:kin of IRRE-like protein 1 [Anneissia japonica]